MKFILLLLLPLSIASSQSTGSAKTSGSCSPANTGSNNIFNVTCNGITKEQRDFLIRIMNEILANQLGEAEVLLSIQRTVQASSNSGLLIPGNEESPPNFCDYAPSGPSPFSQDFWRAQPGGGKRVYLYFGNSGSIATQFPHTVIKAGDKAFLSLDETRGGLTISMEAYNEEHKIMVQIVDNEFIVNPNRIFRKSLSPDKHSLTVIGENNEEVLKVRFLNPFAISILADFYLPNGTRVQLTPSGWRIGHGALMSNTCSASAWGADIFVP